MVRVLVAIRALAEWNARQLHQLRILFLRLVALCAGNARVLTRQGEPRFGMVKMAH